MNGEVRLPGDKSLSHRAVLFAALAEGKSRIENFLVSGVTRVMLNALSAMGIRWELREHTLTVQGSGLKGLQIPAQPVDCGNSATTLRMLAGLAAAAGISMTLTGSEGLRRRPMARIVEPLQMMGVPVEAAGDGTAPLQFAHRSSEHPLKALDYTLPVASAQVKSCLLLAALSADGETVLREPGPSRDHTERMLRSMGVSIASRVNTGENGAAVYETRLIPPVDKTLKPLALSLPGDISSAAFLMVAGLICPGSEITLRGVGLNPTRTGLVDALRGMGADITVTNECEQGGEPVGDLIVKSSRLVGTRVNGPLVVRMIDEFSAFGTAAAYTKSGEVTEVRDARELRFKESDRITTLCQELAALGVKADENPDGFKVWGGSSIGGTVHAHGDHRLAMAMAVAGLAAQRPVEVEEAEMMNESFPGFVDALISLGADVRLEGEPDERLLSSRMEEGEGG